MIDDFARLYLPEHRLHCRLVMIDFYQVTVISTFCWQASEASALEQSVEDLKKRLEMAEIYAQQVSVCVYVCARAQSLLNSLFDNCVYLPTQYAHE